MTIAIIGSGALGLYYGAMLQQSGCDVHFLLRRDEDAIRRNGLRVTSPNGDFHLQEVKGYRTPEQMPQADLVIIGLKTFANGRLPELVAPLLHQNTAILTLQNGLGNEEVLAEQFGAGRVLGGIAFICSNRGEPGLVHHLAEGRVRLGEFNGGLSSRAEAIASLFRHAGVPCEAVADLIKVRWQKLVWNIPFNGLCTLTGQPTDALLQHPPTRRLVKQLMHEVIDGANAQPLSSPIDRAAFIAEMFALTEPMGAYRPSMMIDRAEGRPLELEAIYGIPLQQAAACGVELPRIAMLYSLLSLGEAQR